MYNRYSICQNPIFRASPLVLYMHILHLKNIISTCLQVLYGFTSPSCVACVLLLFQPLQWWALLSVQATLTQITQSPLQSLQIMIYIYNGKTTRQSLLLCAWGSCILWLTCHITCSGHNVSHSHGFFSLGFLLVSSLSLQVTIWHTTFMSLLATVSYVQNHQYEMNNRHYGQYAGAHPGSSLQREDAV